MGPTVRKEFLKRLVDMQCDFWIVFETRPEYLDREDIAMLSKLRVEVQFGIESGSPDILRIMKKTKQPEKFLADFKETSRIMSDHGILHRANLIFNHPGETRRSLDETFAYMDDLIEMQETYLMWACNGYMHFPGCDLDFNRAYYESTFGTRVRKPRWWQEDGDQFENCHKTIPSNDFTEETVDLWERMFEERKSRLKENMALEALKFAAAKYYWEWRDDPRLTQG
jgi:radical SAM superfamily enzyme YgiQ (UPF0313 family)